MNYLPQSNWGNCSQCGAKDTACVKKKKELWCLSCNNKAKAEKQVEKSNRRQSARNAGNKLRRENILGSQYEESYEAAERQALIHDLDFVHSRLVRMMAADKDGMVECFCCGKRQHWSLQQLSHFIKRMNTLTRWDLRANRNSCRYCNETLGGNLEVFAQKLNEEQPGLAEQLIEIAREPHKWSREEIKGMLIDQRGKLKLIETKFTNPIT